MKATNSIPAAVAAALLSAGAGASAQTPTYPVGVWTGQFEIGAGASNGGSEQYVTLYVLPNGTYYAQIDLIPGDTDCLYLLTGGLVRGTLQVTQSATTPYGRFPVPSTCVGTAEAYGTTSAVQSGKTLKLTVTSSLLTQTYLLSQDPEYLEPSMLTTLAGYWTNDLTGGLELVSATGAFTTYDPYFGCVATGQYSIVDARYNLYSYTEQLSACDPNATTQAFKGLTIHGAAILRSNGIHQQGAWGFPTLNEWNGGLYGIGH